MSWLLDRIARSSRTWTLGLTLSVFCLSVPATSARAQFYGYGVPAYGYGYGVPGYGMGGYGMGGYGMGGYGMGGYGMGGYGMGGYGVGGYGVGGYGYGGYGYGATGPGSFNPLFGVGLTPLGVNSALSERYILGRGTSGYSSSYGAVPRPGAVRSGTVPGSVTVPVPVPGTVFRRP